jgi:hypothetical protein
MTVQDAARRAGIPLDEVFQYAKETMASGDAQAWALARVSQRAVQAGLERLESIAREGPRVETGNGVDEETGKIVFGGKIHNTDLLAAQALVKLGIDAAKLATIGKISPKKALDNPEKDLFDDHNPWDLKDPEDH